MRERININGMKLCALKACSENFSYAKLYVDCKKAECFLKELLRFLSEPFGECRPNCLAPQFHQVHVTTKSKIARVLFSMQKQSRGPQSPSERSDHGLLKAGGSREASACRSKAQSTRRQFALSEPYTLPMQSTVRTWSR